MLKSLFKRIIIILHENVYLPGRKERDMLYNSFSAAQENGDIRSLAPFHVLRQGKTWRSDQWWQATCSLLRMVSLVSRLVPECSCALASSFRGQPFWRLGSPFSLLKSNWHTEQRWPIDSSHKGSFDFFSPSYLSKHGLWDETFPSLWKIRQAPGQFWSLFGNIVFW